MLSRPKSTIARTARGFATLLLAAAVAAAGSVSAFAQNMPVWRDAEIEALVRDYARPIFKAAGLSNDAINIVLVNDESFNAFVAGRRLFINTGALMTAENAERDHRRHRSRGRPHRRRPSAEIARPARARQTMAIIATLLVPAPSSPAPPPTAGALPVPAWVSRPAVARWRSAASWPISAPKR